MFFERNGLRRGEFVLRDVGVGVGVEQGGSGRERGYKVRELGWNADSTVCSVWIERVGEDIGEFLIFFLGRGLV